MCVCVVLGSGVVCGSGEAVSGNEGGEGDAGNDEMYADDVYFYSPQV